MDLFNVLVIDVTHIYINACADWMYFKHVERGIIIKWYIAIVQCGGGKKE